MKKVFVFIFAMMFAFLLVGCDLINTGDNDEAGSDSLEVNQEQSQTKMNELGSNDGYLIKFEYTSQSDDEEPESGSMTVGVKDNVRWVIEDSNNGGCIKVDGNVIHSYSYTDGAFVYESSYENEELAKAYLEVFVNAYTSWLYYANAFDGSLKKGADTTVCGRACYTYTFDMNNFMGGMVPGIVAGLVKGLKLEYKVAVDKEYGITMRLDFVGEAEGDSAQFSYLVTEFKTGSDVLLPTLPEPTPSNED